MTGFTTVYADEFTAPLNTAQWSTYSGTSSASGSTFDPANVTVDTTNGRLVLTAAKQTDGTWRGAGLKHRTDLAFGRFTVRSRIEAGRGVSLVHLLYPQSGWPPEVDFAEDNGGDRNLCTATAHYRDATGAVQRVRATTAVDLTQWHTWVVEWTPGALLYRCDGVPFGSVSGPAVPTVPMHLGLQTEPWAAATSWEHAVDSTTPTTVHTYVDSVRVESYAP